MGAPMSSFEVTRPEDAFLTESDEVAISFWIISIAMIAATVFFFLEAQTVAGHWTTSLHTGGLVTLVAAVHYMYMREYWIQVKSSPIVYRYIDWSITVPLQMIEFNLILKASGKNTSPAMFLRLLIGTIVMLAFGYIGELQIFPGANFIFFAFGMAGWFFILLEIFGLDEVVAKCGVKGKILEHLQHLEQIIGLGEAGTIIASTAGDVNENVKQAFGNMRFIVTFGWSIYPLGYFVGNCLALDGANKYLNLIYNVADFVNKIAFVLACWSCAKSDSEGKIQNQFA
jgi:bacteriorhodopsin